ncbi:autotransporter assembly complex family protein [Shewanella intestini]|uniref:Translocation and assembly module subunit TamA n=1 Tax=Shewanella intestini TaxID=2017544 RepID=A0ABS5HYZ0_9GAMM|nr:MULTISPECIES: autotransporter assembly complex family protein [Shewanella]MBR9726946.1 outer membrane protein assembly factor [Shewanella intestini]MRG34488.1 BamA/TamA family outer membrane protein [Shewanella sp. XMDDZSB0408]
MPYSYAQDSILSIKINGANRALTNNIRAHLGQEPKTEVQRRAYLFNVEDNVQAALKSMGYYHAKITTQTTPNKNKPWQLSIDIEQGKPVTLKWVDIFFSGDMLDDPTFEAWLDSVTLKPGQVLDHGKYTFVKNQLLTLALARGYFDGVFTQSQIKINRDDNSAEINLHFNSGKRYRFGQVSFEGHTLNTDLLNAMIPFDDGAYYATTPLSNLNRNLLDSGYFGQIKVLPQIEHIQNEQVPIKVMLTPKPSHSIEVGLGADIGNTSDSSIEPRVKLTWRTPQINRFGHFQDTTAEWSPDRPKLLTTYTIPLAHPLDDQFKIKVGLLRDKYGATQVFDPNDNSFSNTGQLESTKYQLAFTRQTRTKNNWLIGYSLEAIKELYTQSDIDYDPEFYLLSYGLSRTQRGDNSLDPKSGFRQTYSIEYADPKLGSSIQLTRFQAKLKWIDTFFDKHRFVSRLDLGADLVSKDDFDLVPPSLRYFAGGDQSIRGYSYQELGPYIDYINNDGQQARQVVGGRYLAVASAEYQYYVTPTWRVATFIDAGNAFDKDQFEPIVSVGGGLHWISPIGPIKLDVGVGLNDTETVARSWRIHLTMGADL